MCINNPSCLSRHASESGICRVVFPKSSYLCLPWAALPEAARSLQSSQGMKPWIFQPCPCSWQLIKSVPDEMRMLPPDR